MMPLLIIIVLVLLIIELILSLRLYDIIKKLKDAVEWLEKIDTKLNDIRAEIDKRNT